MPTLRERLADWLLGNEKQKLMEGFEQLAEANQYIETPESLLRRLEELDSRYIDMFLHQRGWRPIIGSGSLMGYQRNQEMDRLQAVETSRLMFDRDVMVSRAVKIWTDYGFGQRVEITPRDARLAEIWTEFWHADRNSYVISDEEIQELSNNLITDGELFLVLWASTLDGTATIRTLATDEIQRIETLPKDKRIPVYYVQRTLDGEIWYPDWRATQEQRDLIVMPAGAKLIDDVNPSTTAVIVHVAVEKRGGNRGWPLIARGFAWAKGYSEFIQDRAAVAKLVATYVDKIKANATPRELDMLRGKLDSTLRRPSAGLGLERNPTPAAASTWFENQNVNRERMPLTTGAGDAQVDGMTLAAQFSSASGVPLHYMNRPDSMQNRAVARESGGPWLEQIQRYQTLWASVFGTLVKVVAKLAAMYGDKSFETVEADINLDAPFDADLSEVSSLMGAVTSAAATGQLDANVAQGVNGKLVELALSALGVRDVAGILSPEMARQVPAGAGPEAVNAATENYRMKRITAEAYAEFMSSILT